MLADDLELDISNLYSIKILKMFEFIDSFFKPIELNYIDLLDIDSDGKKVTFLYLYKVNSMFTQFKSGQIPC